MDKEEYLFKEKAIAYDKALERARKLQENSNDMILKKWLLDIFPELKDNKDEKIRKEIIEYIKTGTYRKDWVDWLEKQPKPKDYYTKQELIDMGFSFTLNGDIVTPDKMMEDMKKYLAWQEKQCEKEEQGENTSKPKFKVGDTMRTLQEASNGITDGMPVVVSIDNEYYHCTNELIAIKDQDDYEFPPINMKQNLADNLEPKFKIGDWVVTDKGDTIQICAVNSGYYTMDNGMDFNTSYVDKYWRLWTIKDAKDGDVLVSKHNQPFIYNGVFDKKYVGAYGGLSTSGKYFIKDMDPCHWSFNKGIKPTTKKQCELLFKKMKKEEWEWDAEKKELSKRVIDEGKAEMDYCFTKMMNGEKVSPI